jgi:hypothetical protein
VLGLKSGSSIRSGAGKTDDPEISKFMLMNISGMSEISQEEKAQEKVIIYIYMYLNVWRE